MHPIREKTECSQIYAQILQVSHVIFRPLAIKIVANPIVYSLRRNSSLNPIILIGEIIFYQWKFFLHLTNIEVGRERTSIQQDSDCSLEFQILINKDCSCDLDNFLLFHIYYIKSEFLIRFLVQLRKAMGSQVNTFYCMCYFHWLQGRRYWGPRGTCLPTFFCHHKLSFKPWNNIKMNRILIYNKEIVL